MTSQYLADELARSEKAWLLRPRRPAWLVPLVVVLCALVLAIAAQMEGK